MYDDSQVRQDKINFEAFKSNLTNSWKLLRATEITRTLQRALCLSRLNNRSILFPGASVAEVRPVGLSIAGVGGVAASKPTGTAVVGPGGLAIARPIATAIAGVPPEAVLGSGQQGPGQQSAETRRVKATEEAYVAVGPLKEPGAKYSVVPVARTTPTQIPVYIRIQPHALLSSAQYGHQPVLLYPVAYY